LTFPLSLSKIRANLPHLLTFFLLLPMDIFSLRSYWPAGLALGLNLAFYNSLAAPAFSIAPQWNFEFRGDITGNGSITLNLQDQDSETGSYLVTEVDFSLNFGLGNPQSISLANFPFTQPLRFDPADSTSELYSTLVGSLVSEWRLGSIAAEGEFPGGGLNLSGSPGIGLPPAPPGVGGVIAFTPTGSSQTQTGTWTAHPVPEPLTLLGTATAAGFGAFFKGQINRKKKRSLEDLPRMRHKVQPLSGSSPE
jgi:hypothetical protein